MTPGAEIVATLIAGRGWQLMDENVRTAATHLEKAGAASVRSAWLAKEGAADIFCTGLAAEDIRQKLYALFEAQDFDIIVQPSATRNKKLLAADMESTIIEQEMLDELATDLGHGAEVIAITNRSMNGELDFRSSLRERVKLLKGQPVAILDKVAPRITLMPGAEALLATMKAAGAQCWLVTGGFTHFAKPVARRLGFDQVFANELLVHGGALTGVLAEPILDRNAKKSILEKAAKELKLTLMQTTAIGDGANDLAMLTACNDGGGLGVAYHAKPVVRAAVAHQINHGDLTALLYAQGLIPK